MFLGGYYGVLWLALDKLSQPGYSFSLAPLVFNLPVHHNFPGAVIPGNVPVAHRAIAGGIPRKWRGQPVDFLLHMVRLFISLNGLFSEMGGSNGAWAEPALCSFGGRVRWFSLLDDLWRTGCLLPSPLDGLTPGGGVYLGAGGFIPASALSACQG